MNVSTHAAWVFESNPLNSYQLSVTDTRGRTIPMTNEGLRIQERQRDTFTSTGRVNISPGGSYNAHVNVAELYDLAPGNYTLHAQLRVDTQDIVDEKTLRRKLNVQEPSGSTMIEILLNLTPVDRPLTWPCNNKPLLNSPWQLGQFQ